MPHDFEPHNKKTGSKLNWLRASVLGANDGIVSTASIIVGVAGASSSDSFILTAGVAGMVAGALSMAVGEYISVSTQRDTEQALIEKEKQELIDSPAEELDELTQIYVGKGLSNESARHVAEELTKKDALAAHLDVELGINPGELTDPWHAAYASGISFISGAILPIIMVIISPVSMRIPLTFFAVFIALFITGALSAYAGEANMKKAIIRVTSGGIFAMIVTFGIGKLFGVAGI